MDTIEFGSVCSGIEAASVAWHPLGWRAMDANETPEQCQAEGLEVKQNRKTGKWRVKDVDGPRYKALGNSWAVPVARWIGRRIHTQLLKLEATRG